MSNYYILIMGKNEQIFNTDLIDKKLLNILLDDSRLSYRQIARKMKKSVTTVINRIKKLEKSGIIKKYSADIDYGKLGYQIEVIIDLRISKGKLHEVERKIAMHKNVFAVYDNTGNFDATIIARFKTRKTMDEFLKQIQTYDFVERTETKLILSTIKEDRISIL